MRKNPLKSMTYRKWGGGVSSSSSTTFGAKNNQISGRSMVEMLGVLAIIGVLSIGAIIGFRYALDMHKTNQILNDVRLGVGEVMGLEKVPSDLTQLSLQAESGKILSYYGDERGFLYIKVPEVEDGVCSKLLVRKMERLTDILDKESNKVTEEICETMPDLYFKFNLAAFETLESELPEGEEQEKPSCSDVAPVCEAADCCEYVLNEGGELTYDHCDNPVIKLGETNKTYYTLTNGCVAEHIDGCSLKTYEYEEDPPEPDVACSGTCQNGVCCKEVTTDGKCCVYGLAANGVCLPKGQCITNENCDANQYCDTSSFDSYTSCTQCHNGLPEGTSRTGTCKDIGKVEKTSDGKWIKSTHTMGWWSALNWCARNNGEMLTGPEALGCGTSTGYQCEGSTLVNHYNSADKTYVNTYTDSSGVSQIRLFEASGWTISNAYVWMQKSVEDCDCTSRNVTLDKGAIGSTKKHNSIYAVCSKNPSDENGNQCSTGVDNEGRCCFGGVDKDGNCCFGGIDSQGVCCDTNAFDNNGNCCTKGVVDGVCCELGIGANGKCADCSSNQDCETGYYCDYNPSSNTSNGIAEGQYGTCTAVSVSKTYNGFVRSGNRMDWWSAEAWCQAYSKENNTSAPLITVRDFWPSWDGSNTDYTTGSDTIYDTLWSNIGAESWTSVQNGEDKSHAIGNAGADAQYKKNSYYALCKGECTTKDNEGKCCYTGLDNAGNCCINGVNKNGACCDSCTTSGGVCGQLVKTTTDAGGYILTRSPTCCNKTIKWYENPFEPKFGACCEASQNAYCVAYQGGACAEAGCCTGHVKEAPEGGAEACCSSDDQVAACYQGGKWDGENNSCHRARCCPKDKPYLSSEFSSTCVECNSKNPCAVGTCTNGVCQ